MPYFAKSFPQLFFATAPQCVYGQHV